jgi:DnaJ-class molecular chaperone
VTYILIDEIKEEYFKKDGGSLIVEKEISVIDAIIDLMFLLEPRGLEVVNIALGTEHGKVIRISGRSA